MTTRCVAGVRSPHRSRGEPDGAAAQLTMCPTPNMRRSRITSLVSAASTMTMIGWSLEGERLAGSDPVLQSADPLGRLETVERGHPIPF